MKYRIEYYAPEGHGTLAQPHRIDGVYDDYDSAWSAIKGELRTDIMYPYYDQHGHECYHESDDPGCGGFAIIREDD